MGSKLKSESGRVEGEERMSNRFEREQENMGLLILCRLKKSVRASCGGIIVQSIVAHNIMIRG